MLNCRTVWKLSPLLRQTSFCFWFHLTPKDVISQTHDFFSFKGANAYALKHPYYYSAIILLFLLCFFIHCHSRIFGKTEAKKYIKNCSAIRNSVLWLLVAANQKVMKKIEKWNISTYLIMGFWVKKKGEKSVIFGALQLKSFFTMEKSFKV